MNYLRLQHDWQDIEEDFLRSDIDFKSASAATQLCLTIPDVFPLGGWISTQRILSI